MLFCNAEQIRAEHERLLKESFDKLYENYESETSKLSELFSLLVERLQPLYIPYCKNHHSAHELYERLSTRSKISSFAAKILPQCDGQPIPALLILSVQRIPRYELLLRDLLKATPDTHPDYEGIQRVFGVVK